MKQDIESTLEDFLEFVAEEVERESPLARPAVEKIREVIRSGGKRIRPLFCVLGHLMADGQENARIYKVGASLELLHTFAIIHDDLMDRSATRRGQDTLFHKLEVQRGEQGAGMATLLGDLAFVLSERLFSSSGFEAADLHRARIHLDRMRLHAVMGQYLDLAVSGPPTSNVDQNRQVARLKTASYSVRGPLLIGASLVHPSQELLSGLSSYGDAIGEAFQLHDELSLLGDAKSSGKDPLSDVRQGRPLVLIAEAYTKAGDRDRSKLEEIWGNPDASDSDLQTVREIVLLTGANDLIGKLISDLMEEGFESLHQVAELLRSEISREAARELREFPKTLLIN